METVSKFKSSSQKLENKLYVGFDGGNGNTKVVIGDTEIRCPAYIQEITGRETINLPDAHNGGSFHYLSGSRENLIGTTWITGQPAYDFAPTTHIRIVQNHNGKIEYGLQALLGAIACLPEKPVWNLKLFASIQDAAVLRDDLKEALNGSHTVKFNDSDSTTLVNIEVLGVVEEGLGVLHCRSNGIDPKGKSLLYDFGSGTSIVTVIAPGNKIMSRDVKSIGVENLILSISKHPVVRKHLRGHQGDLQLIRTGIEEANFNYGNSGFEFKAVYNAELKIWAKNVLMSLLTFSAPWKPTCKSVVSVGGGSQLPHVTNFLTEKGITVIKDGAWANARGLRVLAETVGSK